jgi:membrane protease YdiL (CAAX protease family)
MDLILSSLFSSEWILAFQLGFIACITLAVAKSKGYFQFRSKLPFNPPVPFVALVQVFGIYFISLFGLNSALYYVFKFFFPSITLDSIQAWISFLSLGSTCLFLICFLFFKYRDLFREILKSKNSSSSVLHDIGLGIATWLVGFPIVILFNHLLELFLKILSQSTPPKQVAVDHLLSAFSTPYFLLSLITLVVFAPIVEELLFRGFLQNWFKKYTGKKSAILLTSLCFAVLHYSSSQGLSNISLIPALFFLSCFIGFVYERQSSLISPLVMHAFFNASNVISIIFFEGAL